MQPPITNPYQELLNQLTVDKFTVTPSTIPICTLSESVQFDWRVTGPDVHDPPIRFTLQIGTQSVSVGSIGSHSVQISSPIVFILYAEYIDDHGVVRAARTLRMNSITGAPSPNARTITITVAQLASALTPGVQAAVASTLSKYDVSLRSDPGWAIDPSGIHVHLSLAMPTDVQLIDIGVDVTVVPVLNQGQLSFALAYFTAQANFPWWVYVLNPPEVAAVALFINIILIPVLKPELANLLQQVLNNVVLPEPDVPIAQ